jgi:hypothetical protein
VRRPNSSDTARRTVMPQGACAVSAKLRKARERAMQRHDACLDDSMAVAAVRVLSPQERALLLKIVRCPLIPAVWRTGSVDGLAPERARPRAGERAPVPARAATAGRSRPMSCRRSRRMAAG